MPRFFYLRPIRAAGCAKRPGKKWRELHQCNRGREIRAERQADPIRGKQIKNLGSRIPERCGTDQSGRASRGADQGNHLHRLPRGADAAELESVGTDQRGNGSRIPEPIRNAHRRTERSRGRETDTRSRKRPPRGRERGRPIRGADAEEPARGRASPGTDQGNHLHADPMRQE